MKSAEGGIKKYKEEERPILLHSVIGPYEDGSYLVVYACDHTNELTAVCECSSLESAEKEAARMNAEQVRKEDAIQRERELCGLRRMSDDLWGQW